MTWQQELKDVFVRKHLYRWGYFNEATSVKDAVTAFFQKKTKWAISTSVMWVYYRSGRQSLLALLQALGVKEGDEVILPAFTCYCVPEMIKKVGAIPVYVDIDPSTFTPSFDLINAAITPKTKVILIQETFGRLSELPRRIEGSEGNFTIICDYAHVAMPHIRINQTNFLGFISFDHTKGFGGAGGGAIVVPQDEQYLNLYAKLQKLQGPPAFEPFLPLGFIVRVLLTHPRIYWLASPIMKLWTRSMERRRRADIETEFLLNAHWYQKRIATQSLYRAWTKAWSSSTQAVWKRLRYCDGDLRRVYLAKDMKQRGQIIKQWGKYIEIGTWFNSPVHGVHDPTLLFSKFGYMIGDCPVAEDICSRVFNLPAAPKGGRKALQKYERMVKEIEKELEKGND